MRGAIPESREKNAQYHNIFRELSEQYLKWAPTEAGKLGGL